MLDRLRHKTAWQKGLGRGKPLMSEQPGSREREERSQAGRCTLPGHWPQWLASTSRPHLLMASRLQRPLQSNPLPQAPPVSTWCFEGTSRYKNVTMGYAESQVKKGFKKGQPIVFITAHKWKMVKERTEKGCVKEDNFHWGDKEFWVGKEGNLNTSLRILLRRYIEKKIYKEFYKMKKINMVSHGKQNEVKVNFFQKEEITECTQISMI